MIIRNIQYQGKLGQNAWKKLQPKTANIIRKSSIFAVQYLRKDIKHQNCIDKEFKSRLNSGNACCYSVQQ
jgi:hypothetical protein